MTARVASVVLAAVAALSTLGGCTSALDAGDIRLVADVEDQAPFRGASFQPSPIGPIVFLGRWTKVHLR
jgi:hypothetical protein